MDAGDVRPVNEGGYVPAFNLSGAQQPDNTGQATCGRLGVRKARIAEFREEMELIRLLLDGGQVKEDSKFYQIRLDKTAHPPLHRGVGTTNAGGEWRAGRRGDADGDRSVPRCWARRCSGYAMPRRRLVAIPMT